MKNITLSADERLIESARRAAELRGTSLNQLIREYLEELAGEGVVSSEFERLRDLSAMAAGRRGDWRFDRDEIHRRDS